MWNNKYMLLTMLLIGFLMSPVIAIFILAMGGVSGLVGAEIYGTENFFSIWSHLISTILPRQLLTTLLLMVGVGLFTAFFGVGAAWYITFYNIPGRRWFEWLMLLPLAIPTYISAYVYVEVVDPTGPLKLLWSFFNPNGFDIRSLAGAIFCMGVVLTPYVYVCARASFLRQSAKLINAARILGARPLFCFWRIGLPLCRPALFVGIALALMECLNDIGAVEYLGVQTLTVGVYDTWLSRGQLGSAVQLALILLALMAFLIFIEKTNRSAQENYGDGDQQTEKSTFRLSSLQFFFALTICSFPIIFGFLLPSGILLKLSGAHLLDVGTFLPAMQNSFLLALMTGVITLIIGLFLAMGFRFRPSPLFSKITQIVAAGYAIPGTVLGLGILICLTFFDSGLAKLDSFLPGGISIFLTGSIFGLLFAYSVRFLSISYNSIEAGLARIPPQMDIAARSLGASAGKRFWRIHLPLIKPTLLGALVLVFVDTLKELPATLILRPFNFETLATQIYNKASLGLIEEAAIPALLIIAIGILPVILITRLMTQSPRLSDRPSPRPSDDLSDSLSDGLVQTKTE